MLGAPRKKRTRCVRRNGSKLPLLLLENHAKHGPVQHSTAKRTGFKLLALASLTAFGDLRNGQTVEAALLRGKALLVHDKLKTPLITDAIH